MKLKDIVMQYLESIKYSIKQKTYLFYLQMNDIYIVGFNKDISLRNLNEFLVSIKGKYSYSTTKLIKGLINRSLNFAFENGLIKEKIVITLHLKSQQIRKIKALEKQEQEKLEKYIYDNKRIYSYGVLISLYTGLRLGELLALKWENIDFKHNLLKVTSTLSKCLENHKQIEIIDSPKTNSSIREIPLTNDLIMLFKELKNKESEYVVSNRKGQKIDYRTYQASFEHLLKKLNITHYGFHSLRHTFATRLLENGVDIKTISELLGHSSPTITLNRYVHTNIENKRKALLKITKNRLN